MTGRLNMPLRLAAVAATTTVVCAMTAFPAAAADGGVQVTNTETVQVYTSSTGEVESQRVYEQISMTGNGIVDLKNPVSDDGVRNLDGFGGFDVDGGIQTAEVEVSGEERLRTVSDFNGKLPLDVSVEYRLDGERVEPGDVVGESGQLEVTFTVKNITGEDQEVSFPDGNGGTVTKTVNVPIPMVGSLTTNTPSSFTDVKSKQANMAGDGKGGTKLSFTMTLFPPIGSDIAEFGYTATISDGVVPEAAISALPVNPLESPTFATAATSYKGGADTGIELTDGASQIDANLLKLRDGAGELLAGLIKLRDGAQQLEAGLAGEAAPGAGRLAAGADELNTGLGKIDDGAGKLAEGAGTAAAGGTKLRDGAGRLADGAGRASSGSEELADGTGAAAKGSKKLANGAGRLHDGLGELSGGALELDAGAAQIAAGQKALRDGLRLLEAGVQNLPASVRSGLATDSRYQALLAGMAAVVEGIGDKDEPASPNPKTLFGGLNSLKAGLEGDVVSGVDEMLARIPDSWAGLDCASQILSDITSVDPADNAAGECFPGGTRLPLGDEAHPVNKAVLVQMAAQLRAGRDKLSNDGDLATPALTRDTLEGGLTLLKLGVQRKLVPGIDGIKDRIVNDGADPNCAVGAQTPEVADDCGLKQAVAFFRASVPVLVDGITGNISKTLLGGLSVPSNGCDPKNPTLLCGAEALVAGGNDLKAGTEKLLAGSGELDAGGLLLSQKVGELAAGLEQIDKGAGELSTGLGVLASGADELSDGTVTLEDGLVQLADGAGELAAGTGTAADGSGRLADGADELAAGLGDAAEGSGKIAGGLEDAAAGAPRLKDGAQRLSDEGTKKLVAAGQSTAQNYGELYATIEAGAERASAENMAFGAPEGAIGLTAYSYEIQGEDGEGSRNLARGLGGLAVLGAGAAAFGLRRRII